MERGGHGSLFLHGPKVPPNGVVRPFEVFLAEYDSFVHILDDVSLPIVLHELDTATDFLDYLSQKEAGFAPAASKVRLGKRRLWLCS